MRSTAVKYSFLYIYILYDFFYGDINAYHSTVGHAFCGMCILQWFKTSKICPTCKEPVRRQPIQINSLQKLCK